MAKNKLICIKICDNCGSEVKICHKKRLTNKNIFCSRKCQAMYIKTHNLNATCPVCNKKFKTEPSHKKKTKNVCCSLKCSSELRKITMSGKNNHQYNLKGKLNSSWKSDEKITNYGYIKVRELNHPLIDCDGFIFKHRLIAEKYLMKNKHSVIINNKKYLSKKFCVHHIDENKLNNSIDNLLILTKSEHMKLHKNFLKK